MLDEEDEVTAGELDEEDEVVKDEGIMFTDTVPGVESICLDRMLLLLPDEDPIPMFSCELLYEVLRA